MYETVAAPQTFLDIRDQFLNRYAGQNLQGLNIDRVADYFGQHNLEPKPHIVVTPDDLTAIHEIDTVGLLGDVFKKGGEGLYIPELGISIVLRNPALEAQNGPAYTEGMIVHEDAHSTAAITQLLYDKSTDTCHAARVGLLLPLSYRSSGCLIEEGWADYHKGSYLSQHSDKGTLDHITSVVGWKRSVDEAALINLGGRQTPLPFKYLKLAENGRPMCMHSALAGFAMELLIQADPKIYTAIRTARSEVAGLKDVARKIGALHPGLYSTLRQKKYTERDFTQGLHTVIDTVGGGSSQVIYHRTAKVQPRHSKIAV